MEEKRKILMVSITKLDRIVIETLEKETGKKCDELFNFQKPTPVSDLRRHLICFRVAVKAFRLRKRYTDLIFWQQFIGLYYNLLCCIFKIRNFPRSIILTVIFIKRHTMVGRVHHFLYRLAFRSKYIHKMVCHSSTERNYYLSEFGKDLQQKVEFCKLGEGLIVQNFSPVIEKKYFFSGGASNRDYATLIEAFTGLEEQLIIACRPENIGDRKIPSNVIVKHNSYGEDFSNLMKKSYSVILPINDPTISAGQLVLLNAMKFGKSSIVTGGNCMADYVDTKYSIEVPAKSVEKLREAVVLLSKNPELNNKMSVNAYNSYCKNYSIDKYAEGIAGLINGFERETAT